MLKRKIQLSLCNFTNNKTNMAIRNNLFLRFNPFTYFTSGTHYIFTFAGQFEFYYKVNCQSDKLLQIIYQ